MRIGGHRRMTIAVGKADTARPLDAIGTYQGQAGARHAGIVQHLLDGGPKLIDGLRPVILRTLREKSARCRQDRGCHESPHARESILKRVSAFFQIRKKVHWSDTDAAGVVWFPNFLRWFEDAEDELFASLGRSRQSLLDSHRFGMPRVEVHSKFRAPARAGQIVRVGIRTTIENPRRLHHAFEIRDDDSNALLAEGFVRVACVDSGTWSPRDLPEDVLRLVSGLPDLAERQARGSVEMPWT